MLSKLRPTLCYKNLSPDIKTHDQDIEADEYDYNGRLLLRGNLDPNYDLSVYWLYDSDLNCVGLSEHDPKNEDIFEPLWFYNNPYATLLQEPEWTSIDKTLWNLLSDEAYQDCLEDEFTNVIDRSLGSNIRLVTPDVITNIPSVYECQKCKKKSILEMNNCSTVKQPYFQTKIVIFIDSDYILYMPPQNSKVWSLLNLKPPGASSQEPVEEVVVPEPEAEFVAPPLEEEAETV